MKDKMKYLVIGVVVVILLIVLFIQKGRGDKTILTFGEISSTVEKNDFSAVYFGKLNADVKKVFNNMKETYGIKTYTSRSTLNELNNLLEKAELSTESLDVYVLFANSTPKAILDNSNDFDSYKLIIDKELLNKIPEGERKYKIADDAQSITKLIRSNKYTVLVFGYDGCNYCKLYLPVINKIAGDYKTDIYYFNRDTYDQDEYSKVLSLGLEIPARCTLSGEDTNTAEAFPKPMTLITKNGKTVDCIRGYVEEDKVLETLKKYKIIKG